MNFLAYDLGAESGRAILGQLHAGILDIREALLGLREALLAAELRPPETPEARDFFSF